MKSICSTSNPLSGIVPPLVTPLNAAGALDVEGFERLIERVIAGGVSGLFVLGSSGEGPCLPWAVRHAVTHSACRIAAGRVPVLVGITNTAVEESVGMACVAAEAGASAVVATTPYYFVPDDVEIELWARHLAAQCPLPLFLYNMPSCSRTCIPIGTVRHLLDVENIIGIKDSSGLLPYMKELCEVASAREGWTVLSGSEELLVPSMHHGARGGVLGGAMLDPRLFVDLYHAFQHKDDGKIDLLQTRARLLGRIYSVNHHAAAVFKALKCALHLLGVCEDRMARPLQQIPPEECEKIRQILHECGLLNN